METINKNCSIKGCSGLGQYDKKTSKRYLIKGYCSKHYNMFKKYGSPFAGKYVVDGKSKHPYYGTYRTMLSRCMNKNSHKYHLYGGRGIKVCKRWQGKYGFNHFIKDMGKKPSPEYSLDRINNDGDYGPNNCRWASTHDQNTNRRDNSDHIGVYYWKKRKKFVAFMSIKGKRVSSYHNTLNQAIKKRKLLKETTARESDGD